MECARVAIFEDNEDVRLLLSLNLGACGHSVAVEAESMDAARSVIETSSDDAFDVAIVDANLDTGTIKGEDGDEIARLLRQKAARVAIISFSASHHVEGADSDAGKDIKTVVELIASL